MRDAPHNFVPLKTSMVPLKVWNVYILQILKGKQTEAGLFDA